jgi:hypothetical protein
MLGQGHGRYLEKFIMYLGFVNNSGNIMESFET